MAHKKKSPQVADWLQDRVLIGAKEKVFFPDLGLHVKAKVDTGARTSSLHAECIETFEHQDRRWVRFVTCEGDYPSEAAPSLELPVYDFREVRSSNGEVSQRYVVRLWIELGPVRQKIEVTLADRSRMKYPMLLGRKALEEHFLVAPGSSYLLNPS